MAGLWPWGSGRILRPRDARIAFMPQQPYMPRGTLHDALDYPHDDTPPDPARTEKIRSYVAAATRSLYWRCS